MMQPDFILPHQFWIDIHLIFLYIAPNRSYFRNPTRGGQRIFYIVVLNASEFLQIPTTRDVSVSVTTFESVPKNLSQTCGIRSQSWVYVLRKQSTWQCVEFFENATATPIKLNVFFKNNIDTRKAKHGRTSNGFYSWNSQ